MNILEARRRTLGKGVYKKTVEGNPAIAQGSLARRYPGITMQGWTEQESTTGANLIDYTQAIPRNENQSVEIIDGGVKWTGDYFFMIPVAGLKKNQNYIMSYESDDAGSWVFSYSDGTFSPITSSNHSTTTDPEKDCNTVFIYKTRPTVAGQDMVFTNIMLNEGSTALPYEPYTGGQPSPNPDYPQEIVSAGKYNEETQKYEYQVKLTGANLFNPANLTGGEIVEYNGVQCYEYTDNSTNFTYVDDFAENTQYCFSVMILSTDGNEEKNTNIIIRYTDGTATTIVSSYNQLVNIVSSANKTVDKITGRDSWGVIRYIDLSMTTLGIGTEPLPYQPYKEQTVILTSDRPLTKWDRLEVRDGQWGWVYKSNHLDLTGTEDFVLYETTENINKFVLYNIPTEIVLNYNTNSGYSNTFLYDPDVLSSEENGTYRIYTSVSTRWLAISIDKSYTLDIFKDFLQEKYEEGNPFIFWYETSDETFVPLSEAEQEQMNELYTFRPTTVLSNDCECEMTLTYKTKKSLEVTT